MGSCKLGGATIGRAHRGNPSVVTTGNMGTQTKHFLILVLLAFCPITLQGLKCWFGVTVNTSGGTGTSNSSAATSTGNFNINDFFNKTLKECDNTTTKACTITGNGTYSLSTCSPIRTHEGCITFLGATACFCTSDGCNESFATAGTEKTLFGNAFVVLLMSGVLMMK